MEYKRDNAIKDITQESELLEILKKAKYCHMGMIDGDTPYVLGFNFGFKDNTLYLHCAKQGHKLDVLRKNNRVCVSFDVDQEFFSRHETVACSWRMRYRSVLLWGQAEITDNYDEKLKALKIIMSQYSTQAFEFNAPSVNNVVIIKIKADKMTGRKFEMI
ncbi:MAG: hypothetical protein CVU05_01735 [Bacteroidetes bacterium HGW-Bacteroidetes-21]|jgi:hypothetical protein|nr:MAG: hypothetical protein CVU05_01735 [Bacteroidetes bacterium HGW-Bacteroidetes-21]